MTILNYVLKDNRGNKEGQKMLKILMNITLLKGQTYSL